MLDAISSKLRRFGAAWLNFTLFNTLWVLGAGVVLYGIRLYMLFKVPQAVIDNSFENIVADILKELSTALFIAYILGFSSEFWAVRRQEAHRHQMLTDISQNVYQAVYSRDLPSEVFSEVKKRILEAKFLRKKFEVELTLHRFDPPSGSKPSPYGPRTQVTLRQCFDMHNITENSEIWPAGLQVDRRVYAQMSDNTNHFQDFSVEVFDDSGKSIEKQKFARVPSVGVQDILSRIDNSDPRYQTFALNVTIPPGGKATVDTRYEQIHPLDGADVLCCTHPATGLKATVVVPKGDFVVEAMSMHPAPEKDKSRSDDPYLKNFEIEQALLPGQGIYYRWYPRV